MLDRVPRPALLAYVFVIIFVVTGFIRVEIVANDVREEGRLRQQAICASYDELVRIMEDIIFTTTRQPVSPETIDALPPSVQAYIAESASSSREFRGRVQLMLQNANCPVQYLMNG